MDKIVPLGSNDPLYKDKNTETGEPGSVVPARLLNNIQEEIVNAIRASGLEPNALDTTQLAQAIAKRIDIDVTPRLDKLTEEKNTEVTRLSKKIDDKRDYVTNGSEAKSKYQILGGKDISDIFARIKSTSVTYSGSGNIVDSLSLSMDETNKILRLNANRHAISYCSHCGYCTHCSYCRYDGDCSSNCGNCGNCDRLNN